MTNFNKQYVINRRTDNVKIGYDIVNETRNITIFSGYTRKLYPEDIGAVKRQEVELALRDDTTANLKAWHKELIVSMLRKDKIKVNYYYPRGKK